ncbi:MAG: terminase gpA endonuclease subunit [Candidatus Ornithomonoglobus sp.]
MSSERARRRRKTRNLLVRCIKKALRRPEQLTVSEWAEKYRRLDESSALPGPWHNSITPYLTGIMDCFNDPYIQHINFIKSTQVGGTEALINAIGWIVTQNPSPTMIVYPTDDLAKHISNDRLKPAFRYTPEIAAQFKEGNSSEINLRFKNMTIYLRSGGSPSKLASTPIRYLFFDEIDKMQGASKKEASPYHLALERTGTFKYTRKIYTCSTPTIKSNYIYKIHCRADEQREYFVPCPHCGEYITLKWGQVRFEDDPDKKMTTAERAATAKYFCQVCGGEILDKQKPAMLKRGEWRDVKGTSKAAPRRVSFHINALYGFFTTWQDAAYEWLEAQGDPAALQNFFNSWLGEPWEDTKIKTSEDMVLEHQADDLQGVVPEWAQLITIGADVQRNSVYFDIVAFGAEYTHQSIIHGQLMSLDELTPFIAAEYAKADGTRLSVSLSCIDSGDQTDKVYTYTYYTPYTVPVKGTAENLNHYRVSTINKVDKVYNGMQLILVDGGKYKDLIATGLQNPPGYGSCMVHANCDLDYARQLTSEHKVYKNRNKTEWQPKAAGIDNHYLDCRVYAMCAADIRGWKTLLTPEQAAAEAANEPEAPQKQTDNYDYGEWY